MSRVGTLGAVVAVMVAPAAFGAGLSDIPGWDDDFFNLSAVNIEISNLQGSYSYADGTLACSAKAGGPVVTVHWDSGSTDDWSFQTGAIADAVGQLYLDDSGAPNYVPGQACGYFSGDGIGLGGGAKDWQIGYEADVFGYPVELWLLAGELDIYRAVEIADSGLLQGSGLVSVTEGLLPLFGLWDDGGQSSVSSFQFWIHDPNTGAPININDFSSQNFTGDMYLTFWPDDEHGVPEPMTLLLFAAPVLVALRRRFG